MTELFLSCMVLSVTTIGALGNPPFLGYQQPLPLFQQPQGYLGYNTLQPLPVYLPQHYYMPPDNLYRGFAYHTDYQNGGRSHVVFVTGPESAQLMERSLASFRQIQPVQNPSFVPELNSKKSSLPVAQLPTKVSTSSAEPQPSAEPLPTAGPQPPVTPQQIAARVSPSTPFLSQFTAPLPLQGFQHPGLLVPHPPVASVYRVQVFPSHIESPFLRAPFPYNPFTSPFYNALPPQVNVTVASAPATTTSSPNIVSEQQESRIVPVQLSRQIVNDGKTDSATASTVQLSDRIDNNVDTSEESSMSTTTGQLPNRSNSGQTSSTTTGTESMTESATTVSSSIEAKSTEESAMTMITAMEADEDTTQVADMEDEEIMGNITTEPEIEENDQETTTMA